MGRGRRVRRHSGSAIGPPLAAWNASAFPLLVQTLAGLLPLAFQDLLIVDPSLPEWLPDLTLQNLRVGQATVTLRFWRQPDGSSAFDVLEKRGTLRVVRQPPPESLTATVWDRLAALVDTVRHGSLSASVSR